MRVHCPNVMLLHTLSLISTAITCECSMKCVISFVLVAQNKAGAMTKPFVRCALVWFARGRVSV